MESREFLDERRQFRFLASGAVLCFGIYALVFVSTYLGPGFAAPRLIAYSWIWRLLGLVCLGLSLLWANGWKTKEQARLFGLLFLVDASIYLLPALATYQARPTFPQPEVEPAQFVFIVLVPSAMFILALSLLAGGKGGRALFAVFFTAHTASSIYWHRVTAPRVQEWFDAQTREASEQGSSQIETVIAVVPTGGILSYIDWGTHTFYMLAFIYLFFLMKRTVTRPIDPA